MRVLFSLALLVHAGFGPGLLLRFPLTGSNSVEPIARFYAFRPVIYALLLVALYVPFISDTVFGSQPMGWREWAVALPLGLIPAFVDEMCKVVLRLHDRRTRADRG